MEEPLLVVAQREVVRGSKPVTAHDVAARAARRRAAPQRCGAGRGVGRRWAAREQVQQRRGDRDPDGEHGGVDEVVDVVGQCDRGHPHEPLDAREHDEGERSPRSLRWDNGSGLKITGLGLDDALCGSTAGNPVAGRHRGAGPDAVRAAHRVLAR